MYFSLKANAKINLGLNVIKKRDDGYHELEMVMAPISLFDIMNIKFERDYGDLNICVNKEGVPVDKSNIIYKIYDRFYDFTGLKREKIGVELVKNIPFAAGLGGGSSNGAFFMKSLNDFHNNILSTQEMVDISKNIGADIPFFIINKPAVVSGIGEKITPFENRAEFGIILIKPEFGISTKEAYGNIKYLENKKFADIEKIKTGLETNNIDFVVGNIENSIQQALLLTNIDVQNFEKRLSKLGEKYFMSGSGSCYYIVTDRKNEEEMFGRVRKEFSDCFSVLNSFI